MGEYPSTDGYDTAESAGERPPATAPAELPAGTIIADKYRVERTLGEGGMGVVVVAKRIVDDERVAIKVLRTEALKNKESVVRFEREARAVMKIGGDHVVRIHDFGALETGAQFIAMEYLEGEDLAKLLKRVGRLPIADAVDYIGQACEALAEAHAAGVVHRDLKPGNLFLTRGAGGEPLVKLLDFGIAKTLGAAHGDGEATLTTTESFVGSPVYMSPEQMITPKKVDPRADVWSIGVTLYRLLTRRLPFEGESPMEICGMIMAGAKPIALRQARAEAPKELEDAIGKCLSREPADRFRNVAELAEAIAPSGTASARASAARCRKRLEGVPSAWETLSSPLLPRIEAPLVIAPDEVETLAARTLSMVTTKPKRSYRLTIALAAVIGALAVVAVFFARGLRAPASPAATTQLAAPAPVVTETAASSATAPPVSSAAAPASASASANRTPVSRVAPPSRTAAPTSQPAATPTSTALPGGVFGGKPFAP